MTTVLWPISTASIVAAANAPDVAGFDSVALESRPVEDATVFESFDLTSHRDSSCWATMSCRSMPSMLPPVTMIC